MSNSINALISSVEQYATTLTGAAASPSSSSVAAKLIAHCDRHLTLQPHDVASSMRLLPFPPSSSSAAFSWTRLACFAEGWAACWPELIQALGSTKWMGSESPGETKSANGEAAIFFTACKPPASAVWHWVQDTFQSNGQRLLRGLLPDPEDADDDE